MSYSPTAEASPAPPRVGFIDVLFAVSTGLLFTSFQLYLPTEWVTIRFYPTVPLMVITTLVVVLGFGRERPILRTLSLPLCLFAGIYVLSAFSVGFDNGVRELVQATLVFGFVTAFAARYSTHSLRQFFKAFAPVAVLILGYTIYWHISNGFYFQWKRLGEPKALFDLLPLMAAAWIWSRNRFPAVLGVLLLALVGVLILLSGERKAYVAFILALALMLNPRHPLAYLAPLAALAGVYFAVQLFDVPYITRQVNTLLALVGLVPAPDSISSVQRAWQLHVGMILFNTSPLFGVGTNGFSEITRRMYSENFVGLHGEFLRILVENGIVGLTAYLLLLGGVVARLIRPLPGAFGASREHRVAWLWFLSLLVYTSFEGANQLLMVLQYSLAYVPLLNFGPTWRPPPAAAESPRPASAPLAAPSGA